ncbi:MAG: DUF1622 domain-containing protein [Phenylobacterium sp.]|jgi:uncharacterized membrane protein|uniref:DUF1622 domain-containing protein n=1 Tax=Phenylobacterium sp. TaxID=1871053 RepID=UPI00391D1897
MPDVLHFALQACARALEIAGVGAIVFGVLAATAFFVRDGGRRTGWSEAYDHYRTNLGRAILIGLELLVGADIIATVTSPVTFESLGLLAMVVGIRTFLSFALETEIEGRWPWVRGKRGEKDPSRPPS